MASGTRRGMIWLGLAIAALAGGGVRAGTVSDAEAAFQNEDYDNAAALYSKAVDEAGADPRRLASALFNRAEVYSRIGKTALALADYARAIELTPDPTLKALAMFSRGDLYSQDRRYPEAIESYTAALAAKPDLVGVRSARGLAYRRMQDQPHALADFEAELALHPRYPQAIRGRAQILGLPDPTAQTEERLP